MKKSTLNSLIIIVLLFECAMSGQAESSHVVDGSYRGGTVSRSYGGGAHFYGGGWGWGPRWGIGLWGLGYPYYPYYYGFSPTDMYVVPTPQQAVPSHSMETNYWFYCQTPQGYYPYVKQCPNGWMKVVPSPPPPQYPAVVPIPVSEVAQPVAPAAKACTPFLINIKFDTSKYDIKPQYNIELKKLADFLKEFPNATGIIEGHTDNDGDKSDNMRLSQRRADSVRNYIINNLGIAPGRLSAVGFGPTRPVADNNTKEGKQRNRRIEANFTCDNLH